MVKLGDGANVEITSPATGCDTPRPTGAPVLFITPKVWNKLAPDMDAGALHFSAGQLVKNLICMDPHAAHNVPPHVYYAGINAALMGVPPSDRTQKGK